MLNRWIPYAGFVAFGAVAGFAVVLAFSGRFMPAVMKAVVMVLLGILIPVLLWARPRINAWLDRASERDLDQ